MNTNSVGVIEKVNPNSAFGAKYNNPGNHQVGDLVEIGSLIKAGGGEIVVLINGLEGQNPTRVIVKNHASAILEDGELYDQYAERVVVKASDNENVYTVDEDLGHAEDAAVVANKDEEAAAGGFFDDSAVLTALAFGGGAYIVSGGGGSDKPSQSVVRNPVEDEDEMDGPGPIGSQPDPGDLTIPPIVEGNPPQPVEPDPNPRTGTPIDAVNNPGPVPDAERIDIDSKPSPDEVPIETQPIFDGLITGPGEPISSLPSPDPVLPDLIGNLAEDGSFADQPSGFTGTPLEAYENSQNQAQTSAEDQAFLESMLMAPEVPGLEGDLAVIDNGLEETPLEPLMPIQDPLFFDTALLLGPTQSSEEFLDITGFSAISSQESTDLSSFINIEPIA